MDEMDGLRERAVMYEVVDSPLRREYASAEDPDANPIGWAIAFLLPLYGVLYLASLIIDYYLYNS